MKININPLTYLLLLTIFFCGRFNYFYIITIILFIHDLGHIIMMLLNKIKISNIDILPFGSIISSDIKYNENSNTLFLISISGILMQLLLYIVFYIIYTKGFISLNNYNIFLFYNKLIILFNLIPIIPLDGSKIINSLLERIIPFKLSKYLTITISLIICFLIGIIGIKSYNLFIILIFLFSKNYEELLSINFIYYRFLLERYLNKYNFKRIKNVNNINYLYKNRLNFINNESEYKLLEKIFKK